LLRRLRAQTDESLFASFSTEKEDPSLSFLLLAPVWAWLLLCVAAPALILLAIALAVPAEAVPPFVLGWNLEPFALALGDPLYREALWGSVRVAGLVAGLCLLVGYPMALAIARAPARWRPILRALVVLPFLSGVLLRLVAWIGILRDEGYLNAALLALGVAEAPVAMLHSEAAMLAGLVYVYLPFMVLPVEARLSAADPALEQAAADLGASPWRAWWRVTWPLSLPGVVAGLVLVAVPVSGEVVVPALLGSAETLMLGRVIWDAFFQERDWPQAAALAMVLLLVVLLLVVLVPAGLVRR
jgi:putrescine transport system permease protein